MHKWIFACLLPLAGPAAAATFVEVGYIGSINPGGANVKAPFNVAGSGFTQSMPFSGTFYYDLDAVPGAGFTNVFFDPASGIPGNEAFTLNFGPLSFNLNDNIGALTAPAIQYNNGQFNGFVFVTDFAFNGNYYQFFANGSVITGVSNAFDPHGFPTGTSLINARFTTGNGNLTAVVPSDLGAVPEPATWAMMIIGFGAMGYSMRRRRKTLVPRPA